MIIRATENRSVGGSIPPLGTRRSSAGFRPSPRICFKRLKWMYFHPYLSAAIRGQPRKVLVALLVLMRCAVCRTSKPREKPYKPSDGGGLFLLIGRSGSRLRRHAYRFQGKQKLIALGSFLSGRFACRRSDGARRAARIASSNTFSIVSEELLQKLRLEGDDPKTHRPVGAM
jgi:hypothetical protein